MAKLLSAADLEGSEVVETAPTAIRVLSASDLEGSEVIDGEGPKTGKLESLARGAIQGATFGFSDEAVGFLESLIGDKTYAQARDESRSANAKARADNPKTFAAGDIGASVATAFVPGLNVAKAAGTGARIAKSAKLGAAAGFGHSEGDDVGTMLKDTAVGAGVGALGGTAVEGVSRVIGGAAKRVADRTMRGITEGAKPNIAEKLVGKAGERRDDVLAVIRSEPELLMAARKAEPAATYPIIRRAREDSSQALSGVYKRIDDASAGTPFIGLMTRVAKVQKGLSEAPETADQAGAVWREMNKIADAWAGRKYIPAAELRKTVTGLQEDARSYYRAVVTGGVAPDAAAGKEIVARTLRDALHEHVEKVATRNPNRVGVQLEDLRAMNRRHSILSDIEDAVLTAANREAKAPPHRMGWLADAVIGVTSPLAFVAKKVLVDSGLGRDAAMIADDKLAAWTRAMQGGATAAALKTAAAQLGIGAAASEALLAWARDSFGVGD